MKSIGDIMDRFTWMSEHYEEKQNELKSLFSTNTVMPDGFYFRLCCRTPDNEVVSALVLEVCECEFTCEHPQTHDEFVTNMVEPYEIERFMEAYLTHKGVLQDYKLDYHLSKVMECAGDDLSLVKDAILEKERLLLTQTFPEFTPIGEYHVLANPSRGEGAYIVKAICKDKLVCLDKNGEVFLKVPDDWEPFEVTDLIHVVNLKKRINKQA